MDARSDVFSFRSVLYEMVTGQRAFRGDSRLSSLSAILKEEPAPDGPRCSARPLWQPVLVTGWKVPGSRGQTMLLPCFDRYEVEAWRSAGRVLISRMTFTCCRSLPRVRPQPRRGALPPSRAISLACTEHPMAGVSSFPIFAGALGPPFAPWQPVESRRTGAG